MRSAAHLIVDDHAKILGRVGEGLTPSGTDFRLAVRLRKFRRFDLGEVPLRGT